MCPVYVREFWQKIDIIPTTGVQLLLVWGHVMSVSLLKSNFHMSLQREIIIKMLMSPYFIPYLSIY